MADDHSFNMKAIFIASLACLGIHSWFVSLAISVTHFCGDVVNCLPHHCGTIPRRTLADLS